MKGRAEAGQGRSMRSGAAIGGPRRLNTSTASRRPARGMHASRSGAGLLASRVVAGRSASSGVAPAWPAKWRRRSMGVAVGPPVHHSTAAQLPARKACSAAQAASASVAGRTQTSWSSGNASACNAATQGSAGGATQRSCRAPSSR